MSLRENWEVEPSVTSAVKKIDPVFYQKCISKKRLNKLPQKENDLKRVIEKWEKLADKKREIAEIMLSNNKNNSAIQNYKKALFLRPDSYDDLIGLGTCYLNLNKFQNAILVFDKAIELDKNKDIAIIKKSQALISLDRSDAAMTLLNSYLNSHESSACVSLKKALLDNDVKDTELINKAIKAIDNAYGLILNKNGFKSSIGKNNELVKQNKEFINSLYEFCNKRYSSLGEDTFCAQCIIIAFYSSISVSHYFSEDNESIVAEGSFNYLYNRLDLENIDSHTEKLIGIQNNENHSEKIRSLIEPLINEVKKRIIVLSDEDKKALLLYAMDKASKIGFYVHADLRVICEQPDLNAASFPCEKETTDHQLSFLEINELDNNYTIEDGILKSFKGENKNVVIPNEVRIIGNGAFAFKSIESIIIPEGVTDIEFEAFYRCSNLKSVSLPQSLKFIGERAFSHCALESLTIPQGVSLIKSDAFECCDNLNTIKVDKSNPYFESRNNCLLTSDGIFVVCTCKDSEAPPDVRQISRYKLHSEIDSLYYLLNNGKRYYHGMNISYRRYYDSMLPFYRIDLGPEILSVKSYHSQFGDYSVPLIMEKTGAIDSQKAVEFIYRKSFSELDDTHQFFDTDWLQDDVIQITWPEFINAFALYAVNDSIGGKIDDIDEHYWNALSSILNVLINDKTAFIKLASSITDKYEEAYCDFLESISVVFFNRIKKYAKDDTCAVSSYFLSLYKPYMTQYFYNKAVKMCCECFDRLARKRIDAAVNEEHDINELIHFDINDYFFFDDYFKLEQHNKETKQYVSNQLKIMFETAGNQFCRSNKETASDIYCKAIVYIDDQAIKDYFREKYTIINRTVHKPKHNESPTDSKNTHFCRKCGAKLIEGGLFCNKCGTKVILSEE